jgi:hypothetical protein
MLFHLISLTKILNDKIRKNKFTLTSGVDVSFAIDLTA